MSSNDSKEQQGNAYGGMSVMVVQAQDINRNLDELLKKRRLTPVSVAATKPPPNS
jgi:hypothetical protein